MQCLLLGHSTPFLMYVLLHQSSSNPTYFWKESHWDGGMTPPRTCKPHQAVAEWRKWDKTCYFFFYWRKGLCHCYTLDIVFNSESNLCIVFWMLTAPSVHILKHFFPRGWDCLGKWQSLPEVEPTWEKWEGLGYLPVCTASWSTQMCPRCLILMPQQWRTAPFLLGRNVPSICKPK